MDLNLKSIFTHFGMLFLVLLFTITEHLLANYSHLFYNLIIYRQLNKSEAPSQTAIDI